MTGLKSVVAWTILLTIAGGPLRSETGDGADANTVIESKLEVGIRLYKNGMFDDAVPALTTAVAELEHEDGSKADLIDAWKYMGATYVRLFREDDAKRCFREALQLEPALEVTKAEFPERIVRVFDATKQGKTKSVIERPSNVPKKAGIGAAGIALIGGGVALLAGGAAVAAASHGSSSTPTPVPSPTADPSTQVTPTTRTGNGVETIDFLSSDPPPGSIIKVGQPISIGFKVNKAVPQTEYTLRVNLSKDAGNACGMGNNTNAFTADAATATVGVNLIWGSPCPDGVVLASLQARLATHQAELVEQHWSIQYRVSNK